jgi:hypothetical protein
MGAGYTQDPFLKKQSWQTKSFVSDQEPNHELSISMLLGYFVCI